MDWLLSYISSSADTVEYCSIVIQYLDVAQAGYQIMLVCYNLDETYCVWDIEGGGSSFDDFFKYPI